MVHSSLRLVGYGRSLHLEGRLWWPGRWRRGHLDVRDLWLEGVPGDSLCPQRRLWRRRWWMRPHLDIWSFWLVGVPRHHMRPEWWPGWLGRRCV